MEEQWVVVVGEGTWVCISISKGLGLPCWCFVVESCTVVVPGRGGGEGGGESD